MILILKLKKYFFELLPSDEVHSFEFDLRVEEEFFFKLLENFEGGLSHTSDEVHSFDFDFWVEEEFYKLLETMEGNLLRSPHEVHSSDFDFGVEEEI